MTEASPLAALVGRALGGAVTEARGEIVLRERGLERERVRYVRDGTPGTLVLERFLPEDALEARLLPFLARKSDRVPAVHAIGQPHRAGAPHWVLREDTTESSACDGDPRAIVDAKLAIERSVAADAPALRAIGVRERSPADIVDETAAVAGDEGLEDARRAAKWLRRWPPALCHGDLRCANVSAAARGPVLTGWRRAHLGCGLLDVVRLAADLAARGDAVLGVDLPKRYAERAGVPLSSDTLRAAELIDRLERRHLRV